MFLQNLVYNDLLRNTIMQIKIYPAKDRPTSKWAGGVTTELWIWPENSDYASRNFRVRISSATVRLQESDFTALPGVVRYITPLSGGFTLSHGGRKVTMSPLDKPYRFDGGVATHCTGKATDFNLMLKGVEGSMHVISGQLTVDCVCCVYPVDGEDVRVQDKALGLKPGDLAVIRPEKGEQVAIETVRAIVCMIMI